MHFNSVQPLYRRLEAKIAILSALCFLMAAGLVSCRPAASSDNAASAGVAEEQTGSALTAVSSAIRPPVQNLKLEGETLRIEDPSRPSVLKLRSGTELHVPASCFVNEAGEVVNSAVELRFQEYHEAAEIIAAGIPMHMQGPGGNREWLQTAGMFDIRGSSNGRPVGIGPGRSMKVNFVSKVGGAYDFWVFDEKQGAWLNQGVTSIPEEEAGQDTGSDAQLKQEINSLMRRTASPPREPKPTPESERLVFSDLDVRQCPDLQVGQPVVLAYAGEDPAQDPRNNKWISKPGIWFKKELKPAKEAGLYQLTLIGDSLYSIPVKRALDKENMEEAMAGYRRAMAEYQANLEMLKNKREILERQASFRREMSIISFGLYNYDIIWNRPDLIPLMANFDFGNLPNQVKELVTIYHITGEGRTVISLPYQDWKSFRYSPGSDNKLLAVLPNDKIAMFTQSDFNAARKDMAQARGESYTFQMRVKDQLPNSLQDLQGLIREAGM